MLEQKSQAVTFLFEFLDSAGLGITSVSAFVSVSRLGTGTAIVALSSETAATEVDATNHPGLYKYTLAGASTGTADEYFATAIWQSGGTPACKTQRALWVVGQPWIEAVDDDATVGDYATGMSPAEQVLVNTSWPINTSASGGVTVDGFSEGAEDDLATAAQYGAGSAASVIATAVDYLLTTNHDDGSWAGGTAGAGSVSYQWPEDGDPVTVSGSPADGVAVWITSDEAGASVVAGTQYTLATGYVTDSWLLDPGTYYAWLQKSGVTFTNPTEITVTE